MPPQGVINNIYSKIDDLQRRIERIQNNPAPTFPIYNPATFPQDSIEGQIALATDDKLYFYRNGAWHTVSGGGLDFDTWPQYGNWFAAETDDPTDSPFGYSFYWAANTVDHDYDGLLIMGAPGYAGFDLAGIGAGYVRVSGPLIIRSSSNDGEIKILDISGSGPGTGGGIQLSSSYGDVITFANQEASMKGETTIIGATAVAGFGGLPNSYMEMQFHDPEGLTIVDKLGNPILQIVFNYGGSGVWSYLMQTGATWQAVL